MKAVIELTQRFFQDDIDIIVESLNSQHKEQVYEFYSMIFSDNFDQTELTRLARQYAGDNAQQIIDLANRLRINLVLQPEANKRLQELNRLNSRSPIVLTSYFSLLQATMLSYIGASLQKLGVLNDLRKEKEKVEQNNKILKDSVSIIAGHLQNTRDRSAVLEQNVNNLQTSLASERQNAQKYHNADRERQHFQRAFVSICARHEALILPMQLQKELDDSTTELDSFINEIVRLNMHESKLLHEKESLTREASTLSRNADELGRIESEKQRQDALLKQKSSNLETLHQKIQICRNRDERLQLLCDQAELLDGISAINEKLEEYNATLSQLHVDRNKHKEIQIKLSKIEGILHDVIQKKSVLDEKSEALGKKIEKLQKELEPYNQEGRSLSSAASVSGLSVSSRSGMYSGLSSSTPHSLSPSRASTSSRPLPSPPLKAASKAPVTTIGSARETLSMEELVKRPVEELKQMQESRRLNIHACDASGRSLLHHACRSTSFNKLAVVQWLLQNNVNTECVDNSKKKPIDYAKDYGFNDIVRALNTKMPKANNSNNQSFSIQSEQSSSFCSSSFFSSSDTSGYTIPVLPTMTPDQQSRFAAEQNRFIESKRKLEEYIGCSGDRVVSQMNHLRSTNGLASYDLNGRASPTSASVGLANSADGLANIRQCLEDCTESSETIEAFYAARYIELVLSRSMSSASSLLRVLTPKTVTNLYSKIGKLDESLYAMLTLRYTLVPLHINANHWVTLLISKSGYNYEINYIDPKGDEIPNNLIKHLRSILGERLRVNSLKANLQSEFDGVNCGLYTIEICKALQPLFGSKAFSSDDIKKKLGGLKLDIVETRIDHLKIVNQIFDEQCAELGLSRPAFH